MNLDQLFAVAANNLLRLDAHDEDPKVLENILSLLHVVKGKMDDVKSAVMQTSSPMGPGEQPPAQGPGAMTPPAAPGPTGALPAMPGPQNPAPTPPPAPVAPPAPAEPHPAVIQGLKEISDKLGKVPTEVPKIPEPAPVNLTVIVDNKNGKGKVTEYHKMIRGAGGQVDAIEKTVVPEEEKISG